MELALVCLFPSQSGVFKTLSVPPAVLVVCPPVYPKSRNLTREKMQGLPPIKKSRRFRGLSPRIKEKSPEKPLLWLWMRRYSATVSSATIIRGRLPVAIFLAPLFGGLPSESAQPITDRPPSLLSYEIRTYRDFSSTAPH